MEWSSHKQYRNTTGVPGLLYPAEHDREDTVIMQKYVGILIGFDGDFNYLMDTFGGGNTWFDKYC